MQHYIVMTIIMIFAGILSTMNVWVDSVYDIRLSMNDAYMISLMVGWMLFFMALLDRHFIVLGVSTALIIFTLTAIRFQLLIDEKQYLRGMIPHHSMAVHMSRRMLAKSNTISHLLNGIIASQNKEIDYMKSKLKEKK